MITIIITNITITIIIIPTIICIIMIFLLQ